jgi:cell division protein FtsA
MAKKLDRSLVVGLDIGTSKIVALVGEILPDGEIEIIGYGYHPSKGLRKGVVVNIEATVQSIQRAVEAAELMAGCQIHSAYTGIAGSHISSLNSHGIVAIEDGEVSHVDIERVIDAAKAVAIPADQKILHVLPQEFMIDNQDGIHDPIGMSGVRLECKVHIVTGAVSAAQNIVKCVKRCGLEVSDIILEQLASSYAVLTEDEKELGVCLVDIGGGTTDIAVFADGAIVHTAVIPIAGDQVTNDIAVALRTPTQSAEKLKVQHGAVFAQKVKTAEPEAALVISSPAGDDGREASLALLTEVIQSRYTELCNLIYAELRRSGLEDSIPAGIVLTGGGSNAPGLIQLAEQLFRMPVRHGYPQNVKGIEEVLQNPMFSTSVGLLQYSLHQQETVRKQRSTVGLKNIMSRMKGWIKGNF